MSESPSLRIAAELRAQIESGELAPGERVPSAREITRRWGVAVATASRALAALRDDGLVRPVPGVGTIVAPRSAPRTARPRRRADHVLSLDRIVAAAVVIADAEGLEGLSMRRVATELGAAPMSLYRHVADKDDLLLRMMDRTLREARLPDMAPPGWRARLEIAARTLWMAFRRHPWLATALSLTRPQAIAGGLAYTEWVLEALHAGGLRSTVAFDVHLTLFTFVRGTAVNLESEAAAQAASGLTNEEWMEGQEQQLRAVTAGGRFPRFERLVNSEYDFDLDGLFERGLRYLLDGLAQDLERERGERTLG
jgi:DNA-binding transcriptional regulator YhcF (GntR family)